MAITTSIPNVIGGLVQKIPHQQNYSTLINNDIDLQAQQTAHLNSTSAHNSSQIVNDSTVSGSKVSDALNTTKSKLDAHIAGAADKHGSDDILNESSVVGTNVSGALNTVQQQVNALVVGGTTNTTIGVYSLTAGGSVNAYTGTFSGLTLFGGLKINATINTLNTGTSTFNLNTLGVKSIKVKQKDASKVDLKGGELFGVCQLEYDGTDFILIGKEVVDTSDSTLTGLTQIVSVNDSNAGISDLTIGGATLNQVVVNGDFANGTTGWVGTASTLSVSNKVLSVIGSGSSNDVYATKTSNITCETNKKVFISARVRVTNIESSQIYFTIGGSISGSALQVAAQLLPVQNQWYKIIGIVTLTNQVGNLLLRLRHVYADAATANGKVMEVDGNVGVFAIPLTGTPYESYTADQMNALIGEYWEGLKSVERVELSSRGVNKFDASKFPQVDNSNWKSVTDGEKITIQHKTTFTTGIPSNILKLKPSTSYSIKVNESSKAIPMDLYKNGVFNATLPLGTTRTFSSGTDEWSVVPSATVAETFTVSKIMLNEGTSILPYEPYDGSKVTVNLLDETKFALSKLPNLVENRIIYE